MKKILGNRYLQMVVMFLAGGAAATFLLPEKIVIKKDKEIVEVEKIVEKEVVKWRTKVIEKEKIVKVSEKKIWRKETFPDGHTIEEEIYESNSEQVARVVEQEKEKYEELLAQREVEFNEKLSSMKIHTNPKRLNVYAGLGTNFKNFGNQYYVGGFNYPIWGPLIMGAEATTQGGGGAALTVGFRF